MPMHSNMSTSTTQPTHSPTPAPASTTRIKSAGMAPPPVRAATATAAFAYAGPSRFERINAFNVVYLDPQGLPETAKTQARAALDGVDASSDWKAAFCLHWAYVCLLGVIPTKETLVNGYSIGMWMQRQRTAYRKRAKAEPEALPDDKVAALEAAPGWAWDRRSGRPLMHEDWVENFEAYLVLCGAPAQQWTPAGRFLYDWAKRQGTAYREGVMPTYRQVLLSHTPGWTWPEGTPAHGNACPAGLSEVDPVALAHTEAFTDITGRDLEALLRRALDTLSNLGARNT